MKGEARYVLSEGEFVGEEGQDPGYGHNAPGLLVLTTPSWI